MARKPSSAEAGQARRASGSPRDRVIDAYGALAEKPFGDIGLAEIADRAGVSLAEFRDLFPSKRGGFGGAPNGRDIVLEGTTGELAEEPARERVLDIMMRGIDAFRPYRDALRSISRDLRHDPARLLPP